jgi:hypothetical protein
MKMGYGGATGMLYLIITLLTSALFYDLSKFTDPVVLNYFIAVCICTKIIYELFILGETKPEALESAQQDQDRIDYDGGRFISDVTIENRWNARRTINEKVFGKFAWDTFPDY